MSFRKLLQIHLNSDGEKTYILYHGTTLDNAFRIECEGFKRSSGGTLGGGVYLAHTYANACKYPKDLPGNEKHAILSLSIKLGRILHITEQGDRRLNNWHENYDTVWITPKPGRELEEEGCVWDPDRIRVLEVLEDEISDEELTDEESADEEKESSEGSTVDDSDSDDELSHKGCPVCVVM